jgi:hypothetical protein
MSADGTPAIKGRGQFRPIVISGTKREYIALSAIFHVKQFFN